MRPVKLLCLVLAMFLSSQALAEELSVKRHLVASGVEDDEPTGEATSFDTDTEKIYCYLELDHQGKEAQMAVLWKHEGKLHHRQPMKILWGPKIRTWAKLKPRPKLVGSWSCEFEDAEGKIVSSTAFSIKLSEADAAKAAAKAEREEAKNAKKAKKEERREEKKAKKEERREEKKARKEAKKEERAEKRANEAEDRAYEKSLDE
ncbi:MAG: DUF2914 domain-containing protein [Myxococcota bacterium]|nr:DUF2914 domain-containing protein [Myxococcota bacterium]